MSVIQFYFSLKYFACRSEQYTAITYRNPAWMFRDVVFCSTLASRFRIFCLLRDCATRFSTTVLFHDSSTYGLYSLTRIGTDPLRANKRLNFFPFWLRAVWIYTLRGVLHTAEFRKYFNLYEIKLENNLTCIPRFQIVFTDEKNGYQNPPNGKHFLYVMK